MNKIDDLFIRLFEYYLITNNSLYSVRLQELKWRIKDVHSFSLDDIYDGIIETSQFFPTVVNFNDAIKKLRAEKYEVLVKNKNGGAQ